MVKIFVNKNRTEDYETDDQSMSMPSVACKARQDSIAKNLQFQTFEFT